MSSLNLNHFKAIFFDADNTVFTLRESIGSSYSRILAKYGIDVQASDINSRVMPVWQQFRPRYLNAADGYKTSPEEEKSNWLHFIRELIASLLTETPSPEVFEEIYNFYGLAESRLVSNGVTELLNSMQTQGKITGVISNNDARVRQALEGLKLAPLFHHIFPTAELGVKKPAPQVFEMIQNQIGIDPHECLYIGDSLELDYYPPRTLGWHSLLYSQNVPEETDIDWFSSFDELKNSLHL